MTWKPNDDYCIRFKDKTGNPRTQEKLSEMVGRIGYIAMEYGFSLDAWGKEKECLSSSSADKATGPRAS